MTNFEAGRGFAKLQPRDGETVLHCGHLDSVPHHFFAMSDGNNVAGINFTRPDGTAGTATWMVLCSSCFSSHANEPERCMRADAVWRGHEPAIKENIQ
jgi:hypothetical protein